MRSLKSAESGAVTFTLRIRSDTFAQKCDNSIGHTLTTST